MLDYEELDEVLARANAETDAAQCHGFLCGQLCAAGYPDTRLWHEFINLRGADESLNQGCYEAIHTLIGEMRVLIASADFDFQLMLPHEGTALETRVEALAEWCHGFLNGFGLADEAELAIQDAECRELIEDFGRICRVGLDEEELEADEQALVELVEYVKIGAITLFTVLQPGALDEDGTAPEVLH